MGAFFFFFFYTMGIDFAAKPVSFLADWYYQNKIPNTMFILCVCLF